MSEFSFPFRYDYFVESYQQVLYLGDKGKELSISKSWNLHELGDKGPSSAGPSGNYNKTDGL